MDDETRFTMIHALAGAAMGWAAPSMGLWPAIGASAALLAFLKAVSPRLLSASDEKKGKNQQKPRGSSWWAGNGLWPYAATMFFVWIIMLNA